MSLHQHWGCRMDLVCRLDCHVSDTRNSLYVQHANTVEHSSLGSSRFSQRNQRCFFRGHNVQVGLLLARTRNIRLLVRRQGFCSNDILQAGSQVRWMAPTASIESCRVSWKSVCVERFHSDEGMRCNPACHERSSLQHPASSWNTTALHDRRLFNERSTLFLSESDEV